MKVCHLTTVHLPFDTRIFYKECQTLAQAGYDVRLIAPHSSNEVVEGVKIVAVPKPSGRLTRMLKTTWQVYRKALKEKAQVYHFHDPELLPIGILLKVFSGTKVIYDVHENVSHQILTKHWIPSLMRRLVAAVFDIFEKLLVRLMDAVVSTTEEIAEKFQRFNPVVVHNYPVLKMLPIPPTTSQKKRGNVLVYIGGISRIRGAKEMVKALEYLNSNWDVRLELIGRLESSKLERELQALQGYRRVCFLGQLPWKEAWEKAQGASAGLVLFHPVPNHLRALPTKLFEYMATGLPVIASNFPHLKKIVEGNKCGLCVEPLDLKAIAQSIEYLLVHPDEAHRMGQNGRQAVMNQYNWESESKKLLEIYREIEKRLST